MAGIAAFVFSLAICALLFSLASPLRRRVEQLRGNSDAAQGERAAQLARMLQPLAKYFQPRGESAQSRVQQLLVWAGYRSSHAAAVFYGSKAALTLFLPLVVLLGAPLFPRFSSTAVWFAVVSAAFLGSLLPSIWLDKSVAIRQRDLRTAFPDALDLLVVCVESGLGLAPALQRVADELMVSHPELGAELASVNAEMRAGVERTQALKNLSARTGLEDIRGLVALLVQTMRFGTSVADALRVYSEEFRDKRMQAAEEQAAKIGTKLIFPLVFCLFPSFFLVAIGPAVLRLIEVFKQLA
jgi:tight adherence protein C